MSDENNNQSQGCLVIFVAFLLVVLVLLVMMCYQKAELSSLLPTQPTGTTEQTAAPTESTTGETKPKETKPQATEPKDTEPQDTAPQETQPQETKPQQTDPYEINAITDDPEVITEDQQEDQEVVQTDPAPTEPETPEERKYLVVIDAGHQAKGNSEKEPIGPGATEKKAKVSSGTQGVATGLEEYKLNLQVAQKLRKILEGRGYQVKMVRTEHNVNLSNAERAAMANDLNADAFIRIHANGDSNPKTQGIMTLCQTKSNPYNGDLYAESKALSQYVLDETVAATGGKKQFVWETDTMSGINWCRVPVTIVEMGYMSNPEEDRLMSTEDYQQKLAQGIANGIDRYFED